MQTWALLVDSYRLLLSRKLFWITLVISVVVVVLYASIGFDANGWFILFGAFHFDSDVLRAGSEWARGMYLGIFSYFIVGFWLTWAATILALVSTAPIYNDFMADGSIDLVLSRPISRTWLFFVKYLGSLLFVVLQVTLFAVGVFLCVVWRVGDWNWSIFWAIPLVTIFFSYLYSFSVLMTMLTRSTMASLLLTMLFWVLLFVADRAERYLNEFRIQNEVMAEFTTPDSPYGPMAVAPPVQPARQTAGKVTKTERERLERERRQRAATAKRRKKELLETAEQLGQWRNGAAVVQAILPKTKQTTDLLDEWIMKEDYSLQAIMSGRPQRERRRSEPNPPARPRNSSRWIDEVQRRIQEDYASRSDAYILGTSLAFEAVVLAFACFLFCRRDF